MKNHAFLPMNPSRVSNGFIQRNPLKTLRVSWVSSDRLKPEKIPLIFQRVSRFQGFTPYGGCAWRDTRAATTQLPWGRP